MIGYFTFNGVSCRSFGLMVEKRPDYRAPAPIVNLFSIPGRNGTLSQDTGAHENIEIPYEVWFRGSTQQADAIKAWLHSASGYCILADTYDADCYRMARFLTEVEIENIDGRFGRSELIFDCMPQRFLYQGDYAITYTASGNIYNPEMFTALPQIRIYGTGTLTVNGYACEINDVDTYVDIDCEQMQAYKDGWSCNGDVYIPSFPKLTSGKNNVVIEGDITKIEIKPRWWRL